MFSNILRCAVMISMVLGLAACAAYFPSPPPPEPTHPLYRCIATDPQGHTWRWISGSQAVAINRALLSCARDGGVNCQIESCKVK